MSHYPLLDVCQPQLSARGYQPEKILSAYDGLTEILGVNWLQRELDRRRGNLFHSHPLLNIFSTASVSSILHALEIYMGLKVFASEPGLKTLVEDLRLEPAFEGAFFSLALALRFQLLGFSIQLEAPALATSKSDFLAIRSGERYMVECTSRPGLKTINTNHPLYLRILQEAGIRQNLLVDLEVQSAKGMEQETTSLFKSVVKEYARSGTSVSLEGQTVRSTVRQLHDYEVHHPSFPENLRSGWDWSNVFDAIAEDEVLANQVLWRVVVRVRQSEARALEEVLDGQIGRKHDQLRCHLEDASSVLFVQTHEDMESLDNARFVGKLKGHFQSLPRLSAVILSNHKWTNLDRYVNERHFYLHEHAPLPFPAALVSQLETLETDFEPAHLVPFINGL